VSGVTAFEYDKNSNLTKITDAESGVTEYVYDPRNLLSTETFPAHNKPDGHFDIREYAYDAANRLKMRKDQLLEVTTYNYYPEP
jgi:YD repeat-containing protein